MIRKRSVILYIVILIAVIVGCLFGAYQYFFGGIQEDEEMQNYMKNSQTAGSAAGTEAAADSDGCIALFGIDTEDGDAGRSDAIMLASIDSDANVIRICSIARDTRVEIEGYGTCKLNAAYAYGGGTLAVQTINECFGTSVTDYVAVNFSGMAEIIDELGGVEVDLSEGELEYLGDLGDGLQAGDDVHLDGEQAVAYSRIRYLDNDDVRTSRQREVLLSLLNTVKTMDSDTYPQLLSQLMEQCTTNLSNADLLALLAQLTPEDVEMEQYAIPSDETDAEGTTIDGTWYYVYDLDAAGEEIRSFLGV